MAYWTATLEQTVNRAANGAHLPTTGGFRDWLSLYADHAPATTNQGSGKVPFQRWFKFKEAFSPKFVADTVASVPYEVRHCTDPFAGSGTTALTCSFLGVSTTGIEVNPFLADLVRAKIEPVTSTSLYDAYARLTSNIQILDSDQRLPPGMPATLREPGVNGRHVFSADVFDLVRMLARRLRADGTPEARLIRVLLGSVLVENSNVIVNGKGRRYRRGWEGRRRSAAHLMADLDHAVADAASDLINFPLRPAATHALLEGDARAQLMNAGPTDLALFSPPYPNSFDYTDVYNLELWMLGYLERPGDNSSLRNSTLRSHVQIRRAGRATPRRSASLDATLRSLANKSEQLWNPGIPDMVDAYFEDLDQILTGVAAKLERGKRAIMVVGDCQYAGVHVDVVRIIEESLAGGPFMLHSRAAVRSMRSSAQHGGALDLSEHCIVLERN